MSKSPSRFDENAILPFWPGKAASPAAGKAPAATAATSIANPMIRPFILAPPCGPSGRHFAAARSQHASSAYFASALLRARRELVGSGEVEVAVVGAEALGDEGGGGAAEGRGVRAGALEREAAQKAGRERVAAAGGVDRLDLEGRNALVALGVDDHRAVGAAGRDHAADAAADELTRARDDVVFAGEREDLLVVREQVVEVPEGGCDPVDDLRGLLAGCEDVGGGSDAGLARRGEDL